MRKTFILEDLDCAHCAQKIQDAVSKIEGVTNCTVKFLTTKLEYDVEDGREAEAERKMREIVKGIEPDVTVVAK